MLSRATTISVNMEDLLLGQILGISPTGIYVSLAITGIVILGLFALHHRLLFASFDPVGSQVLVKRASFVDYALLVMLALVIVIGIQAAGIVLVMAMLVTPAAAAYSAGQTFRLDDDGGRGHRDRGRRDGPVHLLPLQSARRPRNGPGRKRDIRTGALVQAKGPRLRIPSSPAAPIKEQGGWQCVPTEKLGGEGQESIGEPELEHLCEGVKHGVL